MDAEARLESLLDLAVSRGILEDRAGDLRGTKRWRDALVAAGAELARAAADCPTCPRPPDPVADCVRRALERLAIEVRSSDHEDLVGVLTEFEIASMPEAKRLQNGYAAKWP